MTARKAPTREQSAYRKAARKPAGWMLETRLGERTDYTPTGHEGPAEPRREAPPKARSLTRKVGITDALIEATQTFMEASGLVSALLLDGNTGKRGEREAVSGLRCRIGRRAVTWLFYRDRLDNGERIITSKTLGHWPEMDTDAAREAARRAGGRAAESVGDSKVPFGAALDEYLDYLRVGTADEPGISETEKAKRKPARWWQRVKSLRKCHLRPFEAWTLAEMSDRRKRVGQLYNDIAKDTPTVATHVRRVISAVYNRQRELGERLPADNPSLRGIDRPERHKVIDDSEKPRLLPSEFPQWLTQLRRLPSLHRAYHLCNLFTGTRGGELARTKWSDLNLKRDPDSAIDKRRTLIIGDSKNGSNIVIPLSAAIVRCLKMARDAAKAEGIESEFIFPGAESWRDGLIRKGHELRRTYKPVGSALGLPEEFTERLQGRKVGSRVGKGYNSHVQVVRGEFMRDAQRRISRKLVAMFGCDPTADKIEPPQPKPRDVARAAGLATYTSDTPCNAGHVGLRYTATARCCPCAADRNFRQRDVRHAQQAAARRRAYRRRGTRSVVKRQGDG